MGCAITFPALIEKEHQKSGKQGGGGAEVEGHLVVECVIEPAADQTGRQQRHPEDCVVESQPGAFFLLADDVGYQRLLDAVRRGAVQAVKGEEADDGEGGSRLAEAKIDQRKHQIAADDDPLAADFVGQFPERNGEGDRNRIEHQIHDRDEGIADADVACFDQEQGISRIPQREKENDEQKKIEVLREITQGQFPETFRFGALGFLHKKDDRQKPQKSRDSRKQEDAPVVAGESGQHGKGDQWPDDGAAVVHRLMETEIQAGIVVFLRRTGHKTVPGSGADAFSDAFDKADRQDLQRCRHESEQRGKERGDAVTDDHERLVAANLVAPPAGEGFQHRSCAFGDPFDQGDFRF